MPLCRKSILRTTRGCLRLTVLSIPSAYYASTNRNNISFKMHQNLVELTLPELHDAFDTPAVNCRLNLESWQNKNIDRWMWSKWPLLEYVWELTEEKIPYEIGRSFFKHLARAQITGDTTGVLKILFHRETFEILGKKSMRYINT